MAVSIPRLVVIKDANESLMCIHYDKDVKVVCSEQSVFSTSAKIELEPSNNDSKYFHLRFYHKNRYWMADAENEHIVLATSKPEEDDSKASCTLFEPIAHDQHILLKHVHTEQYVVIDDTRVILDDEPTPLTFVNWRALVMMPKHVAFKGDNGKYLQLYWHGSHPYLQFSSDDGNAIEAAHDIHPMPNGSLRIKSIHSGKFWRSDGKWILPDSSDEDINSWFWPVKIDSKTIALKNKSDNKFCGRDVGGDWLSTIATGIPREARLEVEELVLERKIYNVRYHWEDARVFDEIRFVAGTTTVINSSDMEDSFVVKMSHLDTRSHAITTSHSYSVGVKVIFDLKLLRLSGINIEFSGQYTETNTSGDTTTTTVTVDATGTIKVPKKSIVKVGYVGKQGTFTIPFSYTQEDQNLSDGQFVYTEYTDGMYTGVNCYNFQFDILETNDL